MKKSLFALAALGAFATAAQAQSTVTLYGALDSSIGYITGLPQAQNAVDINNLQTTVQTTGSSLNFIDSSFATSLWGMRGSEDLGGGMKANFNLESDILTNTGETHSSGLFRRGANVSIADAKWGELFLGRKGSTFVAATTTMLPVQGNTVHQWRSVINSSKDDQFSNAITYQSPTLMGTAVQVQYALNNSVDKGNDGTIFAANLFNRSITNLTISAAYNNSVGTSDTTQLSAANKGATLASTTNPYVTATPFSSNQEGYAAGLKYKVSPALEVGTFYGHGRINTGSQVTAATRFVSSGATGVGVGYQATPAILLGANYIKTTFAAQMINLQAHYMLSKRTRVYTQLTFNQGATDNNQSGDLSAYSFTPVHCNSSTTTVCADGIRSSGGSTSKASNNGYVTGIIHTF